MTLQRHRSQLIPDVEYSGDGSIFITTDSEGTFPLRHGKEKKKALQDLSYTPEIRSFRSYDSKRDSRKYKQRSRSAHEGFNINGTLSTQSTNSLARKLRRSRGSGKLKPSYLSHSAANSKASSVSSSSGSMFGRNGPQMTPEFANSMKKKRGARRTNDSELDSFYSGSVNSLKKSKKYYSNGSIRSSVSKEVDPAFKNRDISDETLPYLLFIAEGLMLILSGVARLICVYWHQYFASVWSGFILLLLGFIGARHRGDYLSPSKNVPYIVFSFFGAAATMSACGLTLKLLIPTVHKLSLDIDPTEVANQLNFTNWGGKTLFSVDIDPSMVTWANLALDLSSLVFLVMGFRSLTTGMIALDNFWDASFDVTDECDHRGNPRLFNPIEQMILGQATTFIGLIAVLIIDYLGVDQEYNHYFSPVWGSALTIFAGFAATCAGKRTDRKCWGAMAVMMQIGSIVGISVAAVLFTLSLAANVRTLVNQSALVAIDRQATIVIAASQGAYIIVVIFCLVFACGVIFRLVQDNCCRQRKSAEKSWTY